jgi:predicted O-methyltransferase YrrM
MAKMLVSKLRSRISRKWLEWSTPLPSVELKSLVDTADTEEPAIMDDICLPPYRGPRDHDDFTPLIRIAKFLSPTLVVELGTAHGNTVANICRACPNTKVITVNAPAAAQTGAMVTFQLTHAEIGRVYHAHGLSSRVNQIFSNTLDLDLSKIIQRESVDLAIVDACHDTEYVINDFLKVQPYIRKGGAVLLHDTHPSMEGHLMGSYVGCMQLRRGGLDIRHIQNSWWGIWINGPQLTRAI